MRPLILTAALLAAACSNQPVYRVANDPLPVADIEIEPYLGHWYEQARLPNNFERDCVSATARYGLREDGLISVLNTCVQSDGETRDAEGRARLVGEDGEGKLKVSFFGPFWSDYWVIERADDYSWSIVSEPEGRYLWVLTRAETLSPQDRAVFEARVRAFGYRPSDLVWARR
jgi:apolipoprotein D and lipocalin family protein